MAKKRPPLMLGISAIKGLQYFVDEDIESDPLNIRVGYSLETAYDEDTDSVRFVISITFKTKDKEQIFATSTTATIFKIKNLQNFLSPDNEGLNLPQESMETMFSIAFSHARALHAQYTNGTLHEDIIVPIVDPNLLLKNLLGINEKEVDELS